MFNMLEASIYVQLEVMPSLHEGPKALSKTYFVFLDFSTFEKTTFAFRLTPLVVIR